MGTVGKRMYVVETGKGEVPSYVLRSEGGPGTEVDGFTKQPPNSPSTRPDGSCGCMGGALQTPPRVETARDNDSRHMYAFR